MGHTYSNIAMTTVNIMMLVSVSCAESIAGANENMVGAKGTVDVTPSIVYVLLDLQYSAGGSMTTQSYQNVNYQWDSRKLPTVKHGGHPIRERNKSGCIMRCTTEYTRIRSVKNVTLRRRV